MQFAAYYPEIGRWGSGEALAAAEEVFCADSCALLAQFTQRSRTHPQALAAASFVAIAAGFTGSTDAATTWLIEHARTGASPPIPRQILIEAVRLADPAGDWAALRAVPGGQVIAAAWKTRHRALAGYRARLASADGIAADAVLISLLHAHHIRAAGIDIDDERTCLRLARAAALAWQARTGRGRE